MQARAQEHVEVARAAEFFKRFGTDTVSSQALEPGLCYWFDGERACQAYRDVKGAWVAVGGPLCAPDDRDDVMSAFAAAARDQGKRARFFAIEDERFDATKRDASAFDAVSIGLQPEWDPARWNESLAAKASLREQLRRARAKGVVVREVRSAELLNAQLPLHRQVCRMVRDWQKNRAMAPMSFLVSLDLFGNAEIKRYFVAELRRQRPESLDDEDPKGPAVAEGEVGGPCPDKVVAILAAAPIPGRQGWFFEDVLRAHDAPNGSVELLIDHAMRKAEREGIEVVSYGLAPLAGEVHPWLAAIRDRSRWLYDFEGLRAFKAKLVPHHWRPIHLAYPRGERAIRPTIDSLSAFADGSWWAFLMRTIVHAQPILIWWLAILLLPWTLLLVHAPSEFFPSTSVRAAWVAFDLLLFVALIDLALGWRRAKAKFAAALAALDASVGVAQFLLFNRQHLHGALSWGLCALALLAPLGAAVILGIGAGMRDRLYLPMPDRRAPLA